MVESTGVLLASGPNVALRYAREGVRSEIPTAVSTPISNVACDNDGGDAGTGRFTRASGSFIDDGFVKGQRVRSAGFATAGNNGDWIVDDVEALAVTVRDPDDTISADVADTGQTLRILMQTLRGTGRNINLEKNVLESQEIDPDGQETDSRHGFNRVTGAPGFQLCRKDYDDFVQFVMGRDWDSGITIISTGINHGVNTSKQFTAASGSFITKGFRPGDIVTTSGFSNSANNGRWRVTAVAAQALTVYDPNNTLVTESSGASKVIRLTGKRIDIGTEMQTFFVERQFQDIDQFQRFRGCAVDQWALNAEPEAMINGTFNILGMVADAIAGTSISGVGALAASSNSPYAAFEGELFEGGSRIAVATSMNFTLARNRSLNPIIGSKFSPNVFEGTARCTGTMQAYFDSVSLLNKFINETESSLWMRFDDPNAIGTHFMSIVFPRVKYNGGTIDPPQEGPISIEMPFRALKATGLALPGGGTRNTLMTVQVSNDIDD